MSNTEKTVKDTGSFNAMYVTVKVVPGGCRSTQGWRRDAPVDGLDISSPLIISASMADIPVIAQSGWNAFQATK